MATLTPGPAGTVHIAAPHVLINDRLLRQRCAWCGALMLDYDLARTASPCGDDCHAQGCQPQHHQPATWPAGELVEVNGGASWLVQHEAGAELPANSCARLGAATGVERCRCGKPVDEDSVGCTWHEARHVAGLTAALKRIDWQVGREQGSQWLAGELVRSGVRVQLVPATEPAQ